MKNQTLQKKSWMLTFFSALFIITPLVCQAVVSAFDNQQFLGSLAGTAKNALADKEGQKKLKQCPALQNKSTVTVPNIRLLVIHHLPTNPKLAPLSNDCPSGLCNLVAACNAVLNFAITPQSTQTESTGSADIFSGTTYSDYCTPTASDPTLCNFATQGKVLAAFNQFDKPVCVVQSDIAVSHYFGMYVPQLNQTYDWDVYDFSNGKLTGPDDSKPEIVYSSLPPPIAATDPVLPKSCRVIPVTHDYTAHEWQKVLPGNQVSIMNQRIGAAFQDVQGNWWVPKIDPDEFGAIAIMGAGIDGGLPGLKHVLPGFDATQASPNNIQPLPPGVDRTLVDWIGHETGITSIIGADNVAGSGTVGMIPGVKIISVKMVDDPGLVIFFRPAMDWIALHWEDKNIMGIVGAWNSQFITDILEDKQCGTLFGPPVSQQQASVCYFQFNTPVTIIGRRVTLAQICKVI